MLLFFSLIIIIFSHRPLVLTVLTLLTFLYSLLKCDDSLKELGLLTVRYLRWADSRFFIARCFARRQWRLWRLPARSWPWGEGHATPGNLMLSPRMGPSQLFSPSSLTRTEPPRRRTTVGSLKGRGVAAESPSRRPRGPLEVARRAESKVRHGWKDYGMFISACAFDFFL